MQPKEIATLAAKSSVLNSKQSLALLDVMLHEAALLQNEMILHQKESESAGQRTDANLVKIRTMLGAK